MRKIRLFLKLAVAAIVVGLLGWWAASRLGGDVAEPTLVRTVDAVRGDLVEVVTAAGEVLPRKKVSISARVAARIVALPHREGDRVTRGNADATPPVPPSVLVELDSQELRATLRAAEARRAGQAAQLAVAEARIAAREAQIEASRVVLADAERDLRRQQNLLASTTVSQAVADAAQARFDQLSAQLLASERELDAERASLEVIRHELVAAEAEIARARDNLSYTTIVSPIDGTVTRINAEEGELVVTGTMNNAGTVIMEVADLSEMIVRAQVDESVVADVEPGQAAQVNIQAYRDETFDGDVQTVALTRSTASDGTRYYETEIGLITGDRRIYSGLTADVEIETRRHAGVIAVPSQAVVGRDPATLPAAVRDHPEVEHDKAYTMVVFRLIDGRAAVTPVRAGASNLTQIVIESGLQEGDRIISGPFNVLNDLQHDQAVRTAPGTSPPEDSPPDNQPPEDPDAPAPIERSAAE